MCSQEKKADSAGMLVWSGTGRQRHVIAEKRRMSLKKRRAALRRYCRT